MSHAYEYVDDPTGMSGPIVWVNGQDEIMKLDLADDAPVKLDEMPPAIFIRKHMGKTEFMKHLTEVGGDGSNE